MITTPEVKNIYANIQRQLFYLIPEKWDRIYLYASVVEQILDLETGELFFYYFPKGILKKNPINVYEIPSKFNLDEEEYIHLVEKLYQTIKDLRQIYKDKDARLWSNITIKIEKLKFEVEFNYENLTSSKYSSTERHIIWKYNYLGIPIESFNKKERKLIQEYLNEHIIDMNKIETYAETIYKRPIKNNLIEYDREKVDKSYVEEMKGEIIEKESKQKFANQRYTYRKKERKDLKRLYGEKQENEVTYIEQIEKQKNAIKSQILNHL